MKELICITCPRGCRLKIDDNLNVTGNFCPRGKIYAIDEITAPKRVITSTIKLKNSVYPRVSVKSDKAVPKDKIFDVMEELNKVEINAPCKINDIVIKDVLNLGINIIITKNINK